MKSHKNALCLLLVPAMMLTMLAGCTPADSGSTPPAAPVSSSEPAANDSSPESSAGDASTDDTAFSYSDGIDENGFLTGIKALDHVELFNYQAFPIPGDIHQISEETLQTEIESMLAYYATSNQITDRAVVDGDTVNIDYVGSVDGVEFDGGSTMGGGTDVTIGVTSYIDDFLEQLIGHKPGETINVEVTFPDVYQEESLQGKDAVFVTTINYIVEAAEPELTDAFIETNLSPDYGWKTVAEMREGLSAELQKSVVQQYIADYLVNEVPVSSIPDSLTKYQEEAMLQYYRDGAEYYSMEFEEFLTGYAGVSGVDELIETNREGNLQNAVYTLVAQAVAEDAKISVSEEDMIAYFTDYSGYVDQYGIPYLKQVVLFQKVIDSILDNVVLQ